MKKKYISGVMVLALFIFGGCGRGQDVESYIGADQAKQLALNTCGKTADEADSVTADLVRYNDKDYYQIDIMAGGQHFQIEIDALVGEVSEVRVSDVVENRQERVADAGQTVPDQTIRPDTGQSASGQTSQPDPGQSVASQTSQPDLGQSASGQTSHPNGTGHHSGSHSEGYHGQSSDSAAGSSAGTGTVDGMLTLEDAKAKVLAHAGLTADQVTFVEDKLDYENGRRVYELEFYTSDYKEYDYEIDVDSGEIVGFDYDAEHYVPSQPADEAITQEDARKLALSKVSGASDSDIREFEVDYDDGRIEYEGKIIYNGTEYEFEIDGNGQILSWEEEPVRGR